MLIQSFPSFQKELVKIAYETQRVSRTYTDSDGRTHTTTSEELTSLGRAKARALFDEMTPTQRRNVTDHIPLQAGVIGGASLGTIGALLGQAIRPASPGTVLALGGAGALGGFFGGKHLGTKEQDQRIREGSKAFHIGAGSQTGQRTLSQFNNSVAGKRLQKELEGLGIKD